MVSSGRRADAGGRASAGGFDYQHRVAAWFAVRVLAGAAAPPVLSLWTGNLDRVDCETGEPVDDIRVGPVQGAPLAVQAKRMIELSSKAGGELANTIAQFVSHHLLDGHGEDRLVLATSQDASGQVRKVLSAVLDRLRKVGAGKKPGDLRLNGKERDAHTVIVGHVDRVWAAHTGRPPNAEQRRRFLRQCHVLVLDVEPDCGEEREARQLLRTAVVADPRRADSAWQELVGHCARLAAAGSGADQLQLQEVLTSRGVGLQTVMDYRQDVARLAAATENSLRSLEVSLTSIPAPGQLIALRRSSVGAFAERARRESFLVIGDPGIGKTVALHDLARAAGHTPMLFLPVGSTAAASEGELRNELGLQHNLIEVLRQWSPGGGGLLVIDALDAARNDPQADLWRSIIDVVRGRLPEWRVVASVRSWDLRHSPRLKAQFPGEAVHLRELEESELAQAAAAWPDLGALLQTAPPDLRYLLRNPFNLRLAAELLLSGATIGELQQVRDQLELLCLYWEQRVSDRPGGLARGVLLARMCDYAVRHRTLTAPVGEVLAGDAGAGSFLETLLSRAVLTETLDLPAGPSTGSVRFALHVLFDYAVAITVFAVAEDALRARLHDDPDLVLFAMPSIDMHLERLWTADPGRFFETGLAIAGDTALPRLATVVTAEVAARRAARLADLDVLLGPVLAGGASSGALRLLRYLAVAMAIDREDADDASLGVWPTVVERLSENVTVTELPLRIMLDSLVRQGTLLGGDLARCGLAARRLLEYLWTVLPTPVIRIAIEAVIATAESDPAATESLLRHALNASQMTTRGYNDLFWLADGVPRLAAIVPGLVEEIYAVAMAYQETSTQRTLLTPGLIMSMTSTRRQDFDGVRSHLVRHYGRTWRSARTVPWGHSRG